MTAKKKTPEVPVEPKPETNATNKPTDPKPEKKQDVPETGYVSFFVGVEPEDNEDGFDEESPLYDDPVQITFCNCSDFTVSIYNSKVDECSGVF
jgi:hypothetical protein